jgi:hypothetical protein
MQNYYSVASTAHLLHAETQTVLHAEERCRPWQDEYPLTSPY